MTEPFKALVGEVRTRIDLRLAEWLRPRVASATEISPEVGHAAEALAALSLRGGKRLRAALVAAAYGKDWQACEPAMIAIELLQTYLLIHDDWMDDDDLRRGGPTVHVQLRERFGGKMPGDTGAILAGDLASGYAQAALLETDLPAERVRAAAKAFARIQIEVVTGQLAEMRFLGAGPSVETIHALKTASYTVTGPLLLGAALAGADETRAAHFERFGRPLGIAFQLRDDLLGVFGDPSATGKPIWNDIRQGKRTALIAELRGEPLLAKVHGRRDATDAEIESLVRLIESSGAKARVEARLRALCDEATSSLAAMTLSAESRAWLEGAVGVLGERSS